LNKLKNFDVTELDFSISGIWLWYVCLCVNEKADFFYEGKYFIQIKNDLKLYAIDIYQSS